ncbi:hypothetical protein D915_008371 [Fasciola hepatica]|uniref:Uncharacterized protein n=1 Tax=Fasciola hepatica TaxID=6192 RepID=A0A4E0R3B3_FASHE|nr:hypothetical protein D915_008371 [Fasciola hepatica]
MDLLPDRNSSNSSSCSWAVISDESSQDETNPKVCSICGSEIRRIYFYRPSCELCVLCESCQGLNLSGFPGCTHECSKTPCQGLMCDQEEDVTKSTEQCSTVVEPSFDERSQPTCLPGEQLPSVRSVDSCLCTGGAHKERFPSTDQNTVVAPEDHSVCIGDGARSLTEHIIEALQHSSPPIAIPGSFSTMVPHTRLVAAQRLRYSPPVLNFKNTSSSLSRSNSPSPVSFGGAVDAPISSGFSPPSDTPRKSSVRESPALTSSSSSSPPSSERSERNGAVQFLKSVVLHSTAALNNFDLMSLGPLDRLQDESIKSDSSISTSPSGMGIKTRQAPNPIASHTKLWDDEKLHALIGPRSVPKAVSEAAAYNLR